MRIQPTPTSASEIHRQLDLFGEGASARALGLCRREADDAELIEAHTNGMLSALDPHSGYLNRKQFRELQVQTTGEFAGIGAEATMEDGVVKVVAPIEDTPAAKAVSIWRLYHRDR